MKLYARTPAGTGLAFRVLFTGQVRESNGKITSVEIYMPTGGSYVVGYKIEPLPTGRGSTEVLWIDPGDLCNDDATTANQETLRAEVERVKESLRLEALHGPLGENWP